MPTNLKVSDYIILPKKKKNIKLKDVFLKEPPKKKKKKKDTHTMPDGTVMPGKKHKKKKLIKKKY